MRKTPCVKPNSIMAMQRRANMQKIATVIKWHEGDLTGHQTDEVYQSIAEDIIIALADYEERWEQSGRLKKEFTEAI